MKYKLSHLFSSKDIPKGVRVLTFATSVRWVGWGFAETLIPVFIYSFSSTFAEAGLLRSGYEIGLILALPFIGLAADRVKATTLVLIGLFMYVFIGTSYLLVGITGLVIFIAAARLLNGVAYAFDSVGRSTYLRRHVTASKTATVFGYLDTVTNFWWIIAAVIGIVLIRYFSIPTLLFMIVPTTIIAFFIVWRFRKKDKELIHSVPPAKEIGHWSFSREAANWSWPLRNLILINFFIAGAGSVVSFFLPIEAYSEGASLSLLVVFGIVSTIPAVFGWELGKLFDAKGTRSFVYGLILFAVLILSVPFFDGYIWKLIVAFLSGLILEFLSVGYSEMITVHAAPEHFGRVEGIMRSLGYAGSMAGPLIVGIMMDSFGVKTAYISMAILLSVLAVGFNLFNSRFVRQAKIRYEN